MERTIPGETNVFRKGTTEPLMTAGDAKIGDGGVLIECRWIHPEIYDGFMIEWIAQDDLEVAPVDAQWPDIPWLDCLTEVDEADGDPEAIQRALEKWEATGQPARWQSETAERFVTRHERGQLTVV